MTLLVIAGPTAAGKSAAALAVCEAYGATLVSADAMQVYRGMDIGTAKPTAEEQARVPHVGIDVVEPIEPFDAGRFIALAEEAIAQGPVVVAGGTALYIRSLLRGLVETPPVDPAIRSAIAARPNLHAELAAVDPELAERLHPNDHKRLVRGIEVFETTGRKLSALQAEHAARPDRHAAYGLWLDRSDLDTRIDARVQVMLEAGYLEEVEKLLGSGVPVTAKPMRSLGYRHLAATVLEGLPVEEAARRTCRDTRRFARKQRTWGRQLGFPAFLDQHAGAVWEAAEAAFGPRPGAYSSPRG